MAKTRQQVELKNTIAVFAMFFTPHGTITGRSAAMLKEVRVGPVILMTLIVYELYFVFLQKSRS